MTALFATLIAITGMLSMYFVQLPVAMAAFTATEAVALIGLVLAPSINRSSIPASLGAGKVSARRTRGAIVLIVSPVLLFSCAYLVASRYWLLVGMQVCALVCSLILVASQLVFMLANRREYRNAVTLVAVHILCAACTLAACIFGALLLPTALDCSTYLFDRRPAGVGNRVAGQETSHEIFAQEYSLTKDIAYADEYPNSTFDLYTASEDEGLRPVFLYVHGGGYFTGDKNIYDLNAMGPGCGLLFEGMLEDGYAVVSMNYALAPEFAYPTPLIQMTQLVEYLQQHQDEYGLDMSQVVVGGGSAGGQIAGQFAAMQADTEYARELGISACLPDGQIRAVYLGCALIEPERFSAVEDWDTSYSFFQMQRGYFGNPDSGAAEQACLVEHVSSRYPATYITDGNKATFDLQAQALDERLSELGVTHESFVYGREYPAEVLHGYDVQKDSGEAYDNVRQFRAFLSRVT